MVSGHRRIARLREAAPPRPEIGGVDGDQAVAVLVDDPDVPEVHSH